MFSLETYNCVTSAFMHTAADFFGTDTFAFSLTGTVGGASVTRNYAHFTDVIKDTIDARVWLGIHFRAPDVQGAEIGAAVAEWLDGRFFGPVR